MSTNITATDDPAGKPPAFRVMSAATTNATVVKTAAGSFFGFQLSNVAAYDVFLKLYDKATAPVVGTDVPKVTLRIKAQWDRDYIDNIGVNFVNGIAYAITKGITDADATAVALNDCTGQLFTI